MPRVNEPFLGLGYGWNSGENGWGSGYNEMVKILALLASGGVETIQNDPASSPVSGKAYIVGTTPTGSWSGKANHIAYWDTDTLTWLFVAPKVGFEVLVKSRGDKGEWYFYGSSNTWSRSPVVSEAIADHKEESDAHSPQNVGADPAGTAAQLIQDSAVPFPDVWIPFNDSLRMFAGYGREVKVGDDVVARMVNFECSTTRTYIDKSGVLRTAAINEPRFEKQGLLIEGQSTNLLRESARRLPAGCTSVDVTSSQYPNMTASKVTASSTTPILIGGSREPIENSTVYSASAIIDLANSNITTGLIRIRFAYSGCWNSRFMDVRPDGSIHKIGSNTTGSARVVGSLMFLSITTTSTDTASTAGGGSVDLVTLMSDGLEPSGAPEGYGVCVVGFQLEKLPFSSSYIPTNGTAVTRAADKVTIPRLNNDCVEWYSGADKITPIVTADTIQLVPPSGKFHLRNVRGFFTPLTDAQRKALK